jgi:predicted DCC family thiol-disulfide oxidoreductase YuxK
MMTPARARLLYDGDCGVCERLALWVARRLPAWEVVPAFDLDAVRVVAADGVLREGALAVNATLAAIAPALLAVERAGYAAFAARRGAISRLIGARACGRMP